MEPASEPIEVYLLAGAARFAAAVLAIAALVTAWVRWIRAL